MNIVKFILLFIWVLLILAVIVLVIKQIAFGRRKSDENVNTSEAIYLGSLIITVGIIFQKIIPSTIIAYENIYKMKFQSPLFEFLKWGSSIFVSGVILFCLSVYIAKLLSTIFYGRSNSISEFSENNIAYGIVRGAMIITVSILFLPLGEKVIQFLIPTISIPLYH